jgi:transposase
MDEFATTTVGMDLGDKYCTICVLDAGGEVVEETRIRTTATQVERYFKQGAPMRVVLEVGTHSPWVSRILRNCRHETIVANPRRLRLIAESYDKTDRSDAELLARLGRADPKLLKPVQHRAEEAQVDLVVVRSRAALVTARTSLINSVRGQVKAAGARMPSCSARTFDRHRDDIPQALKDQLMPMMACIAQLTREIHAYDERIETLAEQKYPETESLRQIPGVGPQTALTYVLTLEDPTRFRRARSVGAFLGLTRKNRQSGDSNPEKRISKAGDDHLRKLLVQAAHYILGPFGPDSALRQWGLKLAERGGRSAKKRAVVAVARKLSVVMYRLWVSGEDYQPFPEKRNDVKK